LARAHLLLGDPAAALAAAAAGREWPYPIEEPMLRLLAGMALLELGRTDDAAHAFGDALTTADALLALTDRNVAARQVRALALTGLAAATGDPARAAEAATALTQSRAVISAAGVQADTQRLLDRIAALDPAGVLADVRAGREA
jgi:hypothetical protein